jgi:Ca-activated chloride channel family protein
VPTDLVVVLDRSGSMNGEKIEHARSAVHQLIEGLSEEDRFSLVAFSTNASELIPLGHASREARSAWAGVVNAIHAGGGTFMAKGLRMALDTVERSRAPDRAARVILISDGLAAEPHPVLHEQARRAARGEYALSAVGVGADFDETLMASLADAGTGNYYYLSSASALADVFANEFATGRETVATGLVVAIEAADGVSVVEASGYPLERGPDGVVIRPGSLFAGQERRIWVTLRVPTDGTGDVELGALRLSYRAGGERYELALADLPRVTRVEGEQDFFAQLDAHRWAQGVVVEEYNDLKQKVAGYVRSGQRSDAVEAIREFRSRNARVNRFVAAPAVAGQLLAADVLEESVNEAFVGDDQATLQKLLGKALHAEALDKRRAGARR